MKKQITAILLAAVMLLSLASCGAPEPRKDPSVLEPNCGGDIPMTAEGPMVYLHDTLYYSTGEISTDPRCGVMDGQIETTVAENEIPQENNQSNFGTGYGWQSWGRDRVDVLIDGEFLIFQSEAAFFKEYVEKFAQVTAQKLLSGEENLCYSPISLYYAFAMAATGAAGETQKQMYDLLGVQETETLARNADALYERLYRDEAYGKLFLANSVWMRKGLDVKESYVQGLNEAFHAEQFTVDFNQNKTNQQMTDWVAKHTKNLLKPEFRHDGKTMEVLLNTIYYKGNWAEPFSKHATQTDEFLTATGKAVDAEFMHIALSGHAFCAEEFMRASLYFLDGSEMFFVLPAEDVSLEELLETQGVGGLLSGGTSDYYFIDWAVPKFVMGGEMNLIPMLQAMGITHAFDPYTADFSAAAQEPAYISAIRQGTWFSVDEEGVEAAAFTEIAKDEGAALPPEQRLEMILNRPFLYGVRSADTLLFIGVCENPAQQAG